MKWINIDDTKEKIVWYKKDGWIYQIITASYINSINSWGIEHLVYEIFEGFGFDGLKHKSVTVENSKKQAKKVINNLMKSNIHNK